MTTGGAATDGDDGDRPSVWGDRGLLARTMPAGSRRWVPLFKQSFVFLLVLGAAALSTVVPWLTVSDPVAMWSGVLAAALGVAYAAAAARDARLLRAEIVIPALDFVAVGLLRFGTGDSRSLFLPVILLAIIWIAVWPGRVNVLWLLLGSSVTFLLPFVIDPGGRGPSDVVRLAFALTIYAIVGLAVNELARQARQKVDRSRAEQRAVERELDRAASVQQSLLPPDARTLPATFSVVGACVPARTVGGDFYDWYSTPDGMALTVGDVMGKGVGAGMIAAAVRSVVRSSVEDPDPASALRRATVGLATGDDDTAVQFTTCFHVRITPTGDMRWVDAGHGLAFLRRADGRVERLRSTDLPIGIGTAWTARTATLDAADTLVCISDGVLDLFDDELEAVGRVEELLGATGDPAAIVQEVIALAGTEERPDDVTVVAASFVPALVGA